MHHFSAPLAVCVSNVAVWHWVSTPIPYHTIPYLVMCLPSLPCALQTTEDTRAALEKLVQSKISAAQPVRAAEKQAPAQYIRYVYT